MKIQTIIILQLTLLLFSLSFSGCIDFPLKTGTVIVDPAGEADYTTIQGAISGVDSGSTILVRAGTYEEILTIDKQIHLIGDDSDTTIIKNSDTENKITISLMADLCEIENFTIQGPKRENYFTMFYR